MLSRTAMPWFSAPDYWLAREILERLLWAIYLFASAPVPDRVALTVAALPRRVRGRADQAASRAVLARSALTRLPPRDAAPAQPGELVLPSSAATAPSGRGVGQLFRAARCAVRTLPAPADRGTVRPGDDRHPGLPRRERQLRLAELDHDRCGAGRHPGRLLSRVRWVQPAPSDRSGALVRGRRAPPDSARRGPQLVASREHDQPGPGHEPELQPAPPREHVRGVWQRHQGALRGDRGGHGRRAAPSRRLA